MTPLQSPVLVNANAATTQTGAYTPTHNVIAISAQAVLTGSPNGTLKFQACNDELTNGGQTPTNWSDIPGTSVTVAAAGIYLMPKIDCCYEFVQVVWTPSSGSGTISATMKAIGF